MKEAEIRKSPEEQLKIILKGAADCVNREELLKKLEKGTPLTVKLGLDPSAPDIHLGHAVVLRKIKQMQDLGHRAVIVIGDFTGKIGDPTGKSKGRTALSDEQVRANAATYCEQIFKVLDKDKTDVRFNSEWLAKLTFEDVIRLASTTTVARILERDDFQNRYRNQTPIGLHEFFYPLMQAYDSVALQADIELGGSDQTFNVLMGRNLQKAFGQEQQIALFMPILEGLDGVEKMSKSLGNCIYLSDEPEDIKKKIMSMYTDPNHLRVQDPGKVEGNPVFIYLDAFSRPEHFAEFLPEYQNLDELKAHYQRGGLGDVKIKKFLNAVMQAELEPIRNRRKEWEQRLPEVVEILKEGSAVAEKTAAATLANVRKAMRIDYFADNNLLK